MLHAHLDELILIPIHSDLQGGRGGQLRVIPSPGQCLDHMRYRRVLNTRRRNVTGLILV